MFKRRIVAKKIIKRIKKFIPLLILSLIFAMSTVALNLYIPVLIGQGIDKIQEQNSVNFEALVPILMTIGLCVLGVAVFQWFMTIINNKISYNVVKELRNDLFTHIQSLPLKYIDKKQSGDIVSRMISDIDQFLDGLLLGFSQFLIGVLTIIGTLCFMLSLSWQISLVVVLVTPLSFVVASFIANKTHSMFKQQSEIRAEQTAIVDEAIGELKTVKAFSREDEILETFDEVNERLRACSLKATFFSSLTNPATRFVNSIVYAGALVVGALLAINGGISVGGLTSFLVYSNQYTKPFNEISGVIAELQNALACANRVFEILEEETLPNEKDKAHKINKSSDIEIKSVDFSYTKEKELIKDFNLKLKSGQTVAIVGPTGCGKTTVINLLMRFYEVDSGDILIDSVSTKQMSRQTLRNSFGMVLQDTWLKSGSIKDNIKMKNPNATDEEVINAAKSARAHGFIRRLPKGYDTLIGENGGSLSVGQKQLLCIARLMLSLPPMLILDEATSSIDTATELRIQEAFSKMMKGRTTFIVAHRLSTIRNADVILVMDKGRIIEQGNHHELIKKNGFYANLINSQYKTL